VKVSILINNYNYGRFVADAIDSALQQNWPDIEVIVCDDGSTDDSRTIISSYGDKIITLFKENGGQTSAANVAFARCSGDVIFFLDSDDILHPNAVSTVLRQWRDGLSKIQFPMITMSEGGISQGSIYPKFTAKHTPQWARDTIKATSSYMGSPTSGNAWSRSFLEQVFPMPETMRYFDGYLNILSPFFGDVVSLRTPLVDYRINPSNMWTKGFSPNMIANIADGEAATTDLLNDMLDRKFGIRPLDHFRSFTFLMKYIVVKRFVPERCRASWSTIGICCWRSVWDNPTLSLKTRGMVLVWFFCIFAAPKRFSIYLVKLRFVPAYRPPIVEAILKLSGWRGRA
jgi:glycosyltransferase involved in cell wall biosynthesis